MGKYVFPVLFGPDLDEVESVDIKLIRSSHGDPGLSPEESHEALFNKAAIDGLSKLLIEHLPTTYEAIMWRLLHHYVDEETTDPSTANDIRRAKAMRRACTMLFNASVGMTSHGLYEDHPLP